MLLRSEQLVTRRWATLTLRQPLIMTDPPYVSRQLVFDAVRPKPVPMLLQAGSKSQATTCNPSVLTIAVDRWSVNWPHDRTQQTQCLAPPSARTGNLLSIVLQEASNPRMMSDRCCTQLGTPRHPSAGVAGILQFAWAKICLADQRLAMHPPAYPIVVFRFFALAALADFSLSLRS